MTDRHKPQDEAVGLVCHFVQCKGKAFKVAGASWGALSGLRVPLCQKHYTAWRVVLRQRYDDDVRAFSKWLGVRGK